MTTSQLTRAALVIVVVVILFNLLFSGMLFGTINSLYDIRLLSERQLQLWEELQKREAYLTDNIEKGLKPVHIIHSAQGIIRQNLAEEDEVRRKYLEKVEATFNKFFLRPLVSADIREGLGKRDIAEPVRDYLRTLANSPSDEIYTLYLGLDTNTVIKLKSGLIFKPLRQTQFILHELNASVSSFLWRMIMVVGFLMLGAIWGLWKYLLQPAMNEFDDLLFLLQQRENQLQTTMNSIAEAMISTDEYGRVVMMNPVAEALIGTTLEKARNKPVFKIFQVGLETENESESEQKVKFKIFDILENKKNIELQRGTRLISGGTDSPYISGSISPIYSGKRKATGIVLVFRDDTRYLTMQNQLIHKDKMQSVGQLASGIAHDFNNMLSGILGAVEILKSQKSIRKNEKNKKYADLIKSLTIRAADLTEKLLAFARMGNMKSIRINVKELLEETIEILQRTSSDTCVRIDLVYEAECQYILGDSATLQNVFLNLGLNSIQASKKEAHIEIQVKESEFSQQSEVYSGFELTDSRYLVIKWCDSGIGIPEKNLSKIFDPFFSTKNNHEGVGLGLSAVFGTVCELGGAIKVESEEGQGTCFEMLLPVRGTFDVTAVSDPVKTVQGKDSKIMGQVLFVDDETALLEIASELLGQIGMDIITASNGTDAINIYQEKPDEISCVVLDMKMPGLNGLETARELQKISPDVKLIISTGYANPDLLDQAREIGIETVIKKPYELDEMKSKLLKIMS